MTMMFAAAKRVHPDLVGVFDLLHELSQPLPRIHGATVLIAGGGKAVDPDLQRVRPQKKIDRLRAETANDRHDDPSHVASLTRRIRAPHTRGSTSCRRAGPAISLMRGNRPWRYSSCDRLMSSTVSPMKGPCATMAVPCGWPA